VSVGRARRAVCGTSDTGGHPPRPGAARYGHDSLAIGNALLHLAPEDRELAPTFLR